MRRARASESGFTLLELMIATLIMAIIFMGFLSSLTGAFMATNVAKTANTSHATARRLIEEAQQLTYADLLLIDGNALITEDGLAVKIQVLQSAVNLLTLEVCVCRPMQEASLSTIGSMSMEQFRDIPSVNGSKVNFVALTGGARPIASTTRVAESGAGKTGITE